MKCRACGAADCEIVSEDVDIGVGVQTHVLGYDCPVCGPHTICNTCGAWDTDKCPQWCEDIKADPDREDI